jgi:hypothetical protein
VTPQIEILNAAIRDNGGIIAFAQDMGVSHQVIYQWKKRGYVPMDRALIIQNKYGVDHKTMVRSDIAHLLAGLQTSGGL